MARVAGLVLAAGRAQRFGTTKQLAPVRGRPMVVHAVETAVAAGLAPIFVVIGHDGDRVRAALPPGAEAIHNENYADGQAASLRSGVLAVEHAGVDAVVVLLADQPDIASTAVRALLDAHEGGAVVARARYDDYPGHPMLFDNTVWPLLSRVTGDEGARQVFEQLPIIEVPVAGSCPHDIDHPADLRTDR